MGMMWAGASLRATASRRGQGVQGGLLGGGGCTGCTAPHKSARRTGEHSTARRAGGQQQASQRTWAGAAVLRAAALLAVGVPRGPLLAAARRATVRAASGRRTIAATRAAVPARGAAGRPVGVGAARGSARGRSAVPAARRAAVAVTCSGRRGAIAASRRRRRAVAASCRRRGAVAASRGWRRLLLHGRRAALGRRAAAGAKHLLIDAGAANLGRLLDQHRHVEHDAHPVGHGQCVFSCRACAGGPPCCRASTRQKCKRNARTTIPGDAADSAAGWPHPCRCAARRTHFFSCTVLEM